MSQPYIIGDSSPFLKRVLIPFWVIRILTMLLNIAIYALAIAVIGAYRGDVEDNLQRTYSSNLKSVGAVLAVLCIIMVIILACLILDIVCIVKRSRRTLGPKFFLVVNVIQTTIWTVLFILSAIGAQTGLGLIVGIIIYLSFIGLLIYAAVVYHQFRKGLLKGGNYVAVTVPVNNEQQIPMYGNTAYTGVYPQYPNAAYDQQQQQQQMGYGGYYDPQPVQAQQMIYAQIPVQQMQTQQHAPQIQGHAV
ncbi:hypothetical protein QBC46DRAFT_291617 [Diplogelasinospora grovesii]|uniref:Uncharacterized protein n=1 Tax=Diplogelasinospora grovesii TaxID=303347 RepID=A0AAN6N5Y5_9PEZI|nr:hypothetical protein QBC46DRAFT_291617 [Diplogelasinospora grovesii]